MSTTTATRPQETVVSEETAVNIRPVNDFSSIETAILAATTDKKRIARARKIYNDLIKAGKGHHAAGREAIKAALSGLSNETSKITRANKAARVTRTDEVKANANSLGARAMGATEVIKRPAKANSTKTEKIETHEVHADKPSAGMLIGLVVLGAFIGFLVGYVLWLIIQGFFGTHGLLPSTAYYEDTFWSVFVHIVLVAGGTITGAFGGGTFATKPVHTSEEETKVKKTKVEPEDEYEDEEEEDSLSFLKSRS